MIWNQRLACVATSLIIASVSAVTISTYYTHSNASVDGSFGYVFKESTGRNEFLIVNGETIPMRIDDVHSNHESLRLLQSLDWKVLYPNANGKNIMLQGRYTPRTGTFILRSWSIVIPFERIVQESSDTLPFKTNTILSKTISSSDYTAKK